VRDGSGRWVGQRLRGHRVGSVVRVGVRLHSHRIVCECATHGVPAVRCARAVPALWGK